MSSEQRKEKLVKNYSPDSKDAKYCRCVLHVSEVQPEWCLKNSQWGQTINGVTCYNPYAVCTKKLERKGLIECFINYNLDMATEKEIWALLYLKKKLLIKHQLEHNLSGLKKLQVILSQK